MGETSKTDLAQRKSTTMPVGVIVERRPGVTRWVREIWQPKALLPHAGPADWRVLRDDGTRTEYHAATLPVTLYRGEAEAYRVALSEPVPSAYVVMRPARREGFPWAVHLVTISPHEAALFAQSGDEIVEKLALPDEFVAWTGAWIAAHYKDEPFVKRKRRRAEGPEASGPIGDPRIAKPTDIYSAPTARRHGDRS